MADDYDATLYSSADDQRIDEAVSELYEQNAPNDLMSVHQALFQGDASRADILQAIADTNHHEALFMEAVSEFDPENEYVQGKIQRMADEADQVRAQLEAMLIQAVAEERDMAVYPAKDGMAYQGPVVDQDDRFQYQQVAPNTLIAHGAGESLDAGDRSIGLTQDREREEMEIGYGR